ncbi:MAG TPA: ABC transporter ATP-binding protein, partial [Armatimonadota bacterium]|nr:ABC transporter ATP-binding protein [Armatimonadota bacterium]
MPIETVRRGEKTSAPTDEREGLSSIWRYLAFSKPYWPWLIIASVSGLVRMVPNLFLPWFVGRVIDHVIGAGQKTGQWNLSELWQMVGLFVLIMLAHIPASLGRLYGAQIAATSAVRDIRFHLFDRLQHLSLAFHNDRPTGSIVSRLMNDVGTAQSVFDAMFIQLFQQVLIAGTITVYLFARDWQWALICYAALPVYLITTRLVRRPLRKASRETLESMSQMSGYVQERLAMIREVQAFTAETHEKRHLRRKAESLRKYSLRQQMLNTLLTTASEVTRYSGSIIIILYGVYRVMHGHGTPGDVTTFYLYQQQLIGPLEWFSNIYATLYTAAAAADRVFDFFDTVPLVRDEPGAKRLSARRPPVVHFDHISFSYPSDNPVVILNDVSFEAKAGTRVVIVGESGAGKSTLMSILPRFYDVQSGGVIIDGQDIRTVTL